MPSFKVKREAPLSAEHARQYERFTRTPYEGPELEALQKEWVAFKCWHHAQQVAAAAAKKAAAALRRKLARAK